MIKDIKPLKDLVNNSIASREDDLREKPSGGIGSAFNPLKAKYVASIRKGGNVHKLSAVKGITLCKWPLRNSPFARLCDSVMGPPGGAIPFCSKCMELDSGLSSEDEASGDGEAMDAIEEFGGEQ